jgi:hypothetical protein
MTKTKHASNFVKTKGRKTKDVDCIVEPPKGDRDRPRLRTSSVPYPLPSGNGARLDSVRKGTGTKKEEETRKGSNSERKGSLGDVRRRNGGRVRSRANHFNKRLAAGCRYRPPSAQLRRS